MKKWIAPFLTLLFILSLLSVLGFFQDSRRATEKKEKTQIVLTQSREGGEKDTFMIDLLRQLKQIVDGWLKSINEEIEDEDVTRFKVRFLEILRSILEWVKGKIDSWLETSERDMREKGGSLREIHEKRSAASGLG
jgi:septum formation topological specificity factor MinE